MVRALVLLALAGCTGKDDCPEGLLTFYDEDGDGFGVIGSEAHVCAVGRVEVGGDCNDEDPTVNPGVPEVCNGRDDDCNHAFDEAGSVGSVSWYLDYDRDGYGAGPATVACDPPSVAYVLDADDCNDRDAMVSPGAFEVCDADDHDEDCDGAADDADPSVNLASAARYYPDADGDLFADMLDAGTVFCDPPDASWLLVAEDCDDSDVSVYPGAPEVCDGVDDDCDGGTDEDALDAVTWYIDADGDGYGDPTTAMEICGDVSGHVAVAGDCDDARDDVHPGATEVCDGVDDNCDSAIDEAGAIGGSTWYIDADRDGYGDSSAVGVEACDDPSVGSLRYADNADDCDDAERRKSPGKDELCDAEDLDEDCDGAADDADDSVDLTTTSLWYVDDDGDTYGDVDDDGVSACDVPSADLVASGTDCDDGDADIHPTATERCNGEDDDCDAATSEDGIVRLVDDKGVETVVTAAWNGTYGAPKAITASDGTYYLCGGTYYAKITVPAGVDATFTSESGDPADVLISGGDSATVVAVAAASATVVLEDVTITEGFGSYGGHAAGGGLFCAGAAHVENVVFLANDATYGGAIAAWTGYVEIVDTAFESNTADHGASLYAWAGSVAVISGSAFTGNTASEYAGGIYAEGSSVAIPTEIYVDDSVFEENEGFYAGAIALSTYSTVSLSGPTSSVRGNMGDSGYAGGVAVFGGFSELTVDNVDFGDTGVDGDNDPSDIATWRFISLVTQHHYGDDASFKCTWTGCK